MQVLKIILIIVDLVICVALTILAMVQSKDDAGLSSTITGSSSNNFFEKNKRRITKKMVYYFRNSFCNCNYCTFYSLHSIIIGSGSQESLFFVV